MKRICKRPVQLDKLVICYEVAEPQQEVAEPQQEVEEEKGEWYGVPKTQPYEALCTLRHGEWLEREEITLYRIEGRYHDYVYCIRYNDGEKMREWGLLKFGINHGNAKANTHTNGSRKVWLELKNETLYRDDFYFLTYVEQLLGLSFHNITSIDLALDTPFQLHKTVKRLLHDAKVTTILNGKVIIDRNEDRPELTYTMSGSLNRQNKYQTVLVKQKNAVHDKSRGVVVTLYDKIAEIQESKKHYISEHYGNPKELYRVEVHLNAAEVWEFVRNKGIDYTPLLMVDRLILEDMFFHILGSVLRFRCDDKDVSWRYLLGRYGVTRKDIQQQGKPRHRKNSLKDLAKVQANRFKGLAPEVSYI